MVMNFQPLGPPTHALTRAHLSPLTSSLRRVLWFLRRASSSDLSPVPEEKQTQLLFPFKEALRRAAEQRTDRTHNQCTMRLIESTFCLHLYGCPLVKG